MPVGFSESAARRVVAATKRVEAAPEFSVGPVDGSPSVSAPPGLGNWIKITSEVRSAGLYPGVWYRRTPSSFTVQSKTIWVGTPNGNDLSTGIYYRGFATGIVSGAMLFDVDDAWATGGGGGFPTFMGARASLSATQTIPNLTATLITFDGSDYDTNGYFDASTHLFTADANGHYLIEANIYWDPATIGGGTGMRSLLVAKNGGTGTIGGQSAYFIPTGDFALQNVTVFTPLTAADTIQIQASHDSGASHDVLGGVGFLTSATFTRLF